jgi:hypothetical protein
MIWYAVTTQLEAARMKRQKKRLDFQEKSAPAGSPALPKAQKASNASDQHEVSRYACSSSRSELCACRSAKKQDLIFR